MVIYFYLSVTGLFNGCRLFRIIRKVPWMSGRCDSLISITSVIAAGTYICASVTSTCSCADLIAYSFSVHSHWVIYVNFKSEKSTSSLNTVSPHTMTPNSKPVRKERAGAKWHLVNVSPLGAVVLLASSNYRTPIGWMDGSTGANPGAPNSTPEPCDMPFCF